MPTPTCSRLLHPAPNSCRSAADDEAAYASVDFTGAATSHNPAYETLARQGNSGPQSESNYESLDRGGEEGDTAVGAGPRLYDRLSRHGRQDSASSRQHGAMGRQDGANGQRATNAAVLRSWASGADRPSASPSQSLTNTRTYPYPYPYPYPLPLPLPLPYP